MLGPSDLDRVGTRRILTCPYCDRLQSIVPRPATFAIGCRNCHRAFRVFETDSGQEAVRADRPVRIPIGTPGRDLLDRRMDPAGGATERTSRRPPVGRLGATLRRLGAPWIFPWVLAAGAAAMYVLLTLFGTVRTDVRRSLPEGSMTAAGQDAAELDPHPGRVDVEARDTPARGNLIRYLK